MLKDGRYKITFKTPLGDGGGFLIMSAGKIVGGDGDYIYDGTYYVKKDVTKARILVGNYSGRTTSIFGSAKYCWLKAVYTEDEDGKGFHGEAFVMTVSPDIPGIEGTKVPISGRILD